MNDQFGNTVLKLAVVAIASLSIAGTAQSAVFGVGGSSDLQNVFDNITVAGPGGIAPDPTLSTINVATDEIADPLDNFWNITGSGGATTQIIIELAGFAGSNAFGIYDKAFPNSKVELFSGGAGAGQSITVGIDIFGGVHLNNAVATAGTFAGNQFGFYLDVNATGNTWYSDSTKNTADGGADHMYAYQGNNSDWLQIGTSAAGQFTDNEYIFAWEDVAFNAGSDGDFTDFVVIAESIAPIPEPSMLALLGLGLLGFAGGRRLNKK